MLVLLVALAVLLAGVGANLHFGIAGLHLPNHSRLRKACLVEHG